MQREPSLSCQFQEVDKGRVMALNMWILVGAGLILKRWKAKGNQSLFTFLEERTPLVDCRSR